MVGLVPKLTRPGCCTRNAVGVDGQRPAAWDRWTPALVSASHPAQASCPMQIKPHTDCIHRTARVGDGTPPEEVPGHSHSALRDWEIRSLGPGLGFIFTGVGSGTGGARLRWPFFDPSCRKLQKPRPHTWQESPRPRLSHAEAFRLLMKRLPDIIVSQLSTCC